LQTLFYFIFGTGDGEIEKLKKFENGMIVVFNRQK
jgi:hypothetical protein